MPEAGKTFTDTGSDECHDANGPITTGGPLNGGTLADEPVLHRHHRRQRHDLRVRRSPPSTTPTRSQRPRRRLRPRPHAGSALDFDGTNDHVTFGAAPGAQQQHLHHRDLVPARRRRRARDHQRHRPAGLTAIPLLTKGRSESGALLNWFLGIDSATNRIAADFESASDDSNHGIIGTTTLVNGTWYHAAATYDGTTFRLYLNGVLRRPRWPLPTDPARAAPTTPRWHRADHDRRRGGFFNGALDEARVWNIARTRGQILAADGSELTSGTGLIAR